MNEDKELEILEADNELDYDSEGNLCKAVTGKIKNYKDEELAVLLLPHLIEDVTLSNRQLAERTNVDRRTIARFRNSQCYKELLAQIANDQLLSLRSKALQEMAKILISDKASDNSKIKASQVVLQHSEKVAEIMLRAGKEPKQINVDDLIKELENM